MLHLVFKIEDSTSRKPDKCNGKIKPNICYNYAKDM